MRIQAFFISVAALASPAIAEPTDDPSQKLDSIFKDQCEMARNLGAIGPETTDEECIEVRRDFFNTPRSLEETICKYRIEDNRAIPVFCSELVEP